MIAFADSAQFPDATWPDQARQAQVVAYSPLEIGAGAQATNYGALIRQPTIQVSTPGLRKAESFYWNTLSRSERAMSGFSRGLGDDAFTIITSDLANLVGSVTGQNAAKNAEAAQVQIAQARDALLTAQAQASGKLYGALPWVFGGVAAVGLISWAIVASKRR